MLKGKDNAEKIWYYLINAGCNEYGAAGMMGNMQAESGLKPTNLQDSFEKKLGYSDEEYTNAVDKGSYPADSFVHDGAGYGLVQLTFYSLKQEYLIFAGTHGKSIGDMECQLDFLIEFLKKNCKSVWQTLQNAGSVKEASNKVLFEFERPADQGITQQTKRTNYGIEFYNRFAKEETVPTESSTNITKLQDAKHRSNDVRGTYHAVCDLNLRYGANPDTYSVIVTMPKGTEVNCYGYYNLYGNVKWLCVVAKVGGKAYTGYCSSYYLKKG